MAKGLSRYLIAPVGRAAVAGFVDLGLLLHAAALVPLIRPTLCMRAHTDRPFNYPASEHSPLFYFLFIESYCSLHSTAMSVFELFQITVLLHLSTCKVVYGT